MRSGSSFLLAARQCEIAELEQLGRTGELVGAIGRFIHALQRERGISNIYLVSQGRRFATQRVKQVVECASVEQEARGRFDELDTEATRVRNGSRLFSRIAFVLHGLDGLPALRERVAARDLSPADASADYTRLVNGLLAVVFEAADAATDPEISRALVALFNFMQGKEFAGQERAFGARAFAGGGIDAAGQQQWQHLIESQQACLQVFAAFSEPAVLRAEQAGRDVLALAEVERMRRVGCTGHILDPELSHAWYEWATRRIDAMRAMEDVLAGNLQRLCASRIERARDELRDQRALLAELSQQAASAAAPALYGPHLERSILELVQEQSQRLQAMGDELDAVRATLNERKAVERAKGLLMAHRAMSEDEAYKTLRQMAMNQNRRLVDVAQAVLSLADVLPGVR